MIDLRSDTLSKPDDAMRRYMAIAEVGDDGRRNNQGRGEDPTVNKLLDYAMGLTGKDAATFLPTGTMGNMVAMMAYCDLGDSAATAETLHIYRSEKGVFAPRPGGVKPVLYKTDKYGMPEIESLKSALEKNVKVVCTENTNNFCGGTCINIDGLREIRRISSSYGTPIHLDGARVFNAASSLGVSVKEIASCADSIMFCISKGLGAPVGSILCGEADFIKRACDLAKISGGVMRQAGVIAAAGMVALDSAYEHAKLDNRRAMRVADALAKAGGKLRVDLDTVQSNIVKVSAVGTGKKASVVLEELESMGLRAGSVDDTSFRLVFYCDISDTDADEAEKIIVQYSKTL